MRGSDYIEHAWANLWKKKLRTFLTTAGVVIGVGALVTMFAFGQGVQDNIREQFERLDMLNYVIVSPRGGRTAAPGGHNRDGPATQGSTSPDGATERIEVLDDAFLHEITEIEGVEAAYPEMRFPAQVRLDGREQFTLVQVVAAEAAQSGAIQLRAGEPYAHNDASEVLLSDAMLRKLGVKPPEDAVGLTVEIQTVTLDLSPASLLRMALTRGDQRLPLSRQAYPFTVTGVVGRMGFGGPMPIRSDAYIPPGAAEDMRKLVMTSMSEFFLPAEQTTGYSAVTVRVEPPGQVMAVKQELESRGLRTFALMDQFEEMKTGFLIMDMFLLAVGMIGITVASLGIVNTMVMSILERYREIGIMKAVGATDGDVQRIFLFESAMIGLLGGLFGLVLARAVSLVINEILNGLAAREGVPRVDYFSFPLWLYVAAVVFSILISLVAGIYPTLRAARVDPVVALRHD